MRQGSGIASGCVCAAAALVLAVGGTASAQNVEVIAQDLGQDRQGYTLLRVWGSHHDMGFGMGVALAQDIVATVSEVKEVVGLDAYLQLRLAVQATNWGSPGVSDELAGIVDGVSSVTPDAVSAGDLKVLNAYGDWSYACRSHSCWGRYASAPVTTLSSRRLDFPTPFDTMHHHVLCAWDPDDGSVRWVNFAWPGYVTVVTGLNADGTLVSLHDYRSQAAAVPGVMPRSVAARLVLTGMDDVPLLGQLDWAAQQLSMVSVATSGFINFFAPGGHGGVFTCPSGGPCLALRRPQPGYLGGNVLITTNSDTDGTVVPDGGEFIEDYYQDGAPKDIAGHFGSLHGAWDEVQELHLVSVAVRGKEDMSIWFQGRVEDEYTARLELEWEDLFPVEGQGEDAPDAGADGGDGGDAGDGAREGEDAGDARDAAGDAGDGARDGGDAGDAAAGTRDIRPEAGGDAVRESGAEEWGRGDAVDIPRQDSGGGDAGQQPADSPRGLPGAGSGDGCACAVADANPALPWLLMILLVAVRAARASG